MIDLFEDVPEAIANTLVVAQRCAFAAPSRQADPAEPCRRPRCRGGGVARRFAGRAGGAAGAKMTGPVDRDVYFARLDFEIDVIVGMGFPGYFLIVADFIKWAKDHDIPVGPGRGSGAGSVVAWSLTITDLDPLKLGLLFERFLNPERVSMPDFDIDFCETRRGEVIRYGAGEVRPRSGGADHHLRPFEGARGAEGYRPRAPDELRAGRSPRQAGAEPPRPTRGRWIARSTACPNWRRSISNDKQVKRLLDLAMRLEGLPRHSSTHAAGVVIGDRRLDALVPLYRDPRSDMPVTQFDMKYVEGAGLVKFDFLGLKTLSCCRRRCRCCARRGLTVDLDTLEWDDPAVYELLQSGNTGACSSWNRRGCGARSPP